MNIPAALTYLRPNEEWTLDGDSYEGLTWLSDTPQPTEAEVASAAPLAAAAAAAAAAKRVKATAAAVAHARSLGFTDEMIAVMYPGLIEAGKSPTEPEPTFADLTKRDEPPIVDP